MKRLTILAAVLLVLAVTAFPVFAVTSYTVHSVDNIIDQGGGSYNIHVTISITGWTNDGGNLDHTGTVYYDCNGNLVGWFGEVHSHNYSGPVTWYVLHTGGAPGPFRVDVHDVTSPPPNVAAVLAGPLIGSFTVNINPSSNCKSVAVANTDLDGDGIGAGDNCPYVHNPAQEDGWGSEMGDACDTDWYNRSGVQVEGFVQKNGDFHLHGNCVFFADGASSCPVIASFNPRTFTTKNTPLEITSEDANGWSVWLYYLHSNHGADVYQVNTYTTNPPRPDSLIDDRLEIHVTGDTWEWYHRGADPRYHGI